MSGNPLLSENPLPYLIWLEEAASRPPSMLGGDSSSTVAHMFIPVKMAGIEGVETWQTVTGEHE